MGKNNRAKRTISRSLSVMLAFFMVATAVLTGIGGVTEEAYAKAAGDKNKQACDNCKMVLKGDAPSMPDYSSYVMGKNPEEEAGRPILNDQKAGLSYGNNGYSTTPLTYETVIPGAVYRGGNAKSGKQKTNDSDPDIYFDEDPNDFANVLPYGNTYIDTKKLNWDADNDFTIEIAQGAPFKWIAGANYSGLTDSTKEFAVVMDPLGDGSGLADDVAPIIAYVGPVKGYLGNTPEDWRGDSKPAPADGQKNIIDASSLGLEYLYRITYRDAATLKDGTKGNLVITATRVEIETTATQDNAVITLQLANELNLGAHLKKKNGDYINTQEYVAKTADEMRESLQGTGLSGNGWIVDKHTLAATGVIIDLDIKVTDSEDNPVKGSISYAAKDMDIENFQSQWGRSIAGEDKYMFNEALTIVDGSLSYAVTPYYDHAHETTRATGWIPVRPGSDEVRTSPLHITKTGSGSHANGVRFSGVGNVMLRDKNESFKDALANWSGASVTLASEIRTALGNHSRNADTTAKLDLDSYTISDNFKKQLQGKIKDENNNIVPWKQMTNKQIFDYLGDGSFGDRRGDRGTFDTGFAVLMDASGFKLQWSGSMHNAGNIGTNLFDDSIYTYVEQTHGTGGGIYFETYDIAGDCKVNRAEGTVTMGKGTDATVTVVPEDGYRIDTIKIGAKALGNPKTFTPIYDDSGAVTKIKDSTGIEHALTDGKVAITDDPYGSITFEANAGGSIDVTLPNMDDPRHIHADFTADYYFYKVWKSKTQAPTSLKLTATPYAYKFKEVTIDNTKYTITGNTFTGGGKSYELKNNALEIGEAPDITVYYLEGNDLVSYTYDDPNDPDSRRVDERYTIRLEYEKNGEPVTFEVVKADADNADETNVIAETDADGYPVWKIRYPAAGYKTKSGKEWSALPIETKPSAHNINHVERNYWFVTEDAPGWALVEYDNSKAEAPGVIDTAKNHKGFDPDAVGEVYKVGFSGPLSAWALASTKDVDNSGEVIKDAASSNHAYMSVFSDHDKAITKHNDTWGGKIVNIPLVVVNAEKTWDDFSNAFNTRQDVWFHIDATIGGTKTKDVLPPQKLAATESGNVQTKTWGNKKGYGDDYLSEYAETDVNYSKVKVVGTTSDLPKDIYYARSESNPHMYVPMEPDGYNEVGGVQVPKYKSAKEGDTYYVNELSEVDGNGKSITYTLRETDAEGNELDKSDASKYLVGYESEVSDVKKDDEQATLDEVKVVSYTGKVKNTLETVDFEVTKIWVRKGLIVPLKTSTEMSPS